MKGNKRVSYLAVTHAQKALAISLLHIACLKVQSFSFVLNRTTTICRIKVLSRYKTIMEDQLPKHSSLKLEWDF